MSAPAHIDSLHFAKSGSELSGQLKVDQLPRLRDSLDRDDVAVQYRISGLTADGRPALRVQIEVEVWQTCQRCLERFPLSLELDEVLPIARTAAQLSYWEDLDPLLDALVAERQMDIAGLVEDEILLGLPTAPRHPDGECEVLALNQ
ncbi:MAG: DUF177 domain-containing protein [Betaproteobacteria bacterium]|nr:DUF177 domain-containing protein [Betaproteobacteria bacterium]